MKIKPAPRAPTMVLEQETAEAAVSLPELQLKRILVPVDFSESSHKAYRYAVSFAEKFGAEITLLHVVQIIPTPDIVVAESGQINAQMRDAAIKEMAAWRRESKQVSSCVQEGVPYREIVRAADEMNADLIILSTHGRSGLPRLLIGSTAERVVRHSHCPVLVVRDREHDFLQNA